MLQTNLIEKFVRIIRNFSNPDFSERFIIKSSIVQSFSSTHLEFLSSGILITYFQIKQFARILMNEIIDRRAQGAINGCP